MDQKVCFAHTMIRTGLIHVYLLHMKKRAPQCE
jgi:hypothetical protein